jgi:hypothetical protein
MDATAISHDEVQLREVAASDHTLAPSECAERAKLAAALIDPALIDQAQLDSDSAGEAVLLWRDDHSEAWLNLWWEPRDTGYHDHDGSCVGVYVIAGRAWNEALSFGTTGPRIRDYGPGESFAFPGSGIHRMDHEAGALTVHVYSPPLREIGHYELVDGRLSRTPIPGDQPSPPSPALFEAIHGHAPAEPVRQPVPQLA